MISQGAVSFPVLSARDRPEDRDQAGWPSRGVPLSVQEESFAGSRSFETAVEDSIVLHASL